MVLANTLDILSQASTIVEFIFSTDLLNVQRSILGQINKCMSLAYEENVFLPLWDILWEPSVGKEWDNNCGIVGFISRDKNKGDQFIYADQG